MKCFRYPLLLLAIIGCLSQRAATAALFNRVPEGFQRVEFEVEGLRRMALIYVPPGKSVTNRPVVFVFHGHGGTARQAARSFRIHEEWPDAVSVYMQGLNTATPLTDHEGRRPGWQLQPGTNNDRDLKFFDAVLSKLSSEGRINVKRVFATGHSNGGGFVYLLWLERADVLTAVAPSGAAANFAGRLKPKPAMHIAGRNDPLVKFSWQDATIRIVRRINQCEADAKEWARNSLIHPSPAGTPLVTFIHDGGHEFPVEAPTLIVKFFKEASSTAK